MGLLREHALQAHIQGERPRLPLPCLRLHRPHRFRGANPCPGCVCMFMQARLHVHACSCIWMNLCKFLQGELHFAEGIVIEPAMRGHMSHVLSVHMGHVHRAVVREQRRAEAKANERRLRATRASTRAKKKNAWPLPSAKLRTGVHGAYRGGIFYLFKDQPGTCIQ